KTEGLGFPKHSFFTTLQCACSFYEARPGGLTRYGVGQNSCCRRPRGSCFEIRRLESRHRDESLDAFALENFAGVDDSFGIHGNHVEPEELAAVPPNTAHLTDVFAVVTFQEPDVVVGEIGDVKQPLLLVG